MNEIETRDKGLLLCQNLLDKGLLTQSDFEQCSQIYQPSTGLSRAVAGVVQGIPDAKTSAETSFGMSPKQGKDELGYDVSKRPSYTAFFRLANSSMYYRQTNRKGVKNASGTFSEPSTADGGSGNQDSNTDKDNIYMTLRLDTGLLYLTAIDTNSADGAANAVFMVELRQDGNYTIQNQVTKYYLRVGVDPETKNPLVMADSSELTAECLFKQVPIDGGKYEFESVSKPGQYLSAVLDSGLVIGLSGSREGRVWELEFLDGVGGMDGVGMAPEDAYDTAEAKTIINSVLEDVKAARSKYYLVGAQIEFLTTLRDQVSGMVDEDGPLMKYYRDLAASRTPGMTTDLLDSLAYSMKSEIAGRELYAIDQELNKLSLDATKIKQAEMQSGSTKIAKVQQIISGLIDERRKQITGLTVLLDKITTRQNALSSREDIVSKEMNYHDTTGQVVAVNSDISQSRGKYTRLEYWGLLGFLAVVVLCAIFMGYKVWGRWQSVFS
jgi:uncharacterized protein YacL (UPF0231 family)